jgi:hypothetical protein
MHACRHTVTILTLKPATRHTVTACTVFDAAISVNRLNDDVSALEPSSKPPVRIVEDNVTDTASLTLLNQQRHE